MNQDDKRIPAKYHGVKITSGFVITAVTILIFVLLMLVLMKLGVIGVPSFLQSVFGDGERTEQTTETIQSEIPDFAAGSTLIEEHYYTFSVDPRETLAALTEPDAYIREFRVINSYAGEADSRKYTLTVSGNRCRLASDQKTVICDGNTTCTITGTYRTTLNDTIFTPEYEIGITPLSDIKAAAENGSVTYHSSDDKTLLIVSEDAESGVLSEYLVSVESGVVMSERSYINGERYRAVVTDVVDVFAADDLPEDYFEIPQEP